MTAEEFRAHCVELFGTKGGWLLTAAHYFGATPAALLGWLNGKPIPVDVIRSLWWFYTHLPRTGTPLSADALELMFSVYKR
jgi:hypothetical protein